MITLLRAAVCVLEKKLEFGIVGTRGVYIIIIYTQYDASFTSFTSNIVLCIIIL